MFTAADTARPGPGWFLAPLGIFVVMAAALATWLVVAARQLRSQGIVPGRPAPRLAPDHAFDPHRSAKVRGGGRVGSYNATWPLVTLTVDESWARLSGFVSLWIPRDDVTGVQPVRTVGGSGIRFVTTSGDFDAVVFWCNPSTVLAAFRRFGWPA